jgi:hypothetical protein
MFTLREIFQFIGQHDDATLKDYHKMCCDNLKDLNKRSNLLSFFIIIILSFYLFSDSIKKISLAGFDIDQKSILISAPLLLSYFILEWCLIARRRRELMKMIHHLGTKAFALPPFYSPVNFFPYFNLFSRNIMPFSFLIELVNLDTDSKIQRKLNLILIRSLFIGIPIFISYILYISFTTYPLGWQAIGCNTVAAFCLIQIFLFYISEIKLLIQVNRDDIIFLYQINNPPPSNQPTQENPNLNNQSTNEN